MLIAIFYTRIPLKEIREFFAFRAVSDGLRNPSNGCVHLHVHHDSSATYQTLCLKGFSNTCNWGFSSSNKLSFNLGLSEGQKR